MVGGIEEKLAYILLSAWTTYMAQLRHRTPSFFFGGPCKTRDELRCQTPTYVMVHQCVWHFINPPLFSYRLYECVLQCLVKIGSYHICCLRLRTSHGLVAVDQKHVIARHRSMNKRTLFPNLLQPGASLASTCITVSIMHQCNKSPSLDSLCLSFLFLILFFFFRSS